MALYDSAELLATIKNRGMIPANAGAWTDPELLRAASEEIDTWHVPLLVNARGEYLVKEQVIACVVDQAAYLISYRAAAVRSVVLRTTAGTERPVEELNPAKQTRMNLDRTLKGVPVFYSFREGYIDLYPKPDASSAYSLVVKWHIAPNRIVETTNCRQILSKAVDTPTAGKTRLTLATAVPTDLTGAAGKLFDFVGVRKPFPVKGWDVASQSVTTVNVSTTIDFLTADLPTDLTDNAANGDWLCAAQKSPHPNVPHELHSAVALRAAAAACAARNPQLQGTLIAEATGKEQALLAGILAPRNKGAVKRLVQRRW